MKKLILAAIAAVSTVSAVAGAAPLDERSLRCSVPVDAPFFARSAGAISAVTKGASLSTRSPGTLPGVMVDGWRPAPGPLAKVLADLGAEAGFSVAGAEAFGPVIWGGRTASLTQAVDNLTGQVGAVWSFDGKTLKISAAPPAAATVYRASIALPRERDVTLALLDTLRGLDARQVSVAGDRISFAANAASLARIQTSIGGISEIYSFDVSFLEGRPSDGRYSWSKIGSGTATSGAGGQALVADGMASSLLDTLRAAGDLKADGSQTVAGPSGWALVVPQSQCGAGRNEITLRPRRIGDGFALQIDGGGFKTAIPMVTTGQTLLVAATDPVGGWIRMLSIRPRIVAVR